MILSDSMIEKLVDEGRLIIRPLKPDSITPNGVDLSIGDEAMMMMEAPEPRSTSIRIEDELVIPPNFHILILTEEYMEMPNDIVGIVNLRSTYARRGLLIPPTVVDAGYKGRLTLAVRGAPHPIHVKKGERLWHLILLESYPAKRPYSGKYQNSTVLMPGF